MAEIPFFSRETTCVIGEIITCAC